MAEREQERVRERETLPGAMYEWVYAERGDFIELGKNGTIVVKSTDRDRELNRQGHIKDYLMTSYHPDTVLQNWYVFVHDIAKQSGKHRHQGGLVLFVIQGEGATEVNGERIDWEEGDCILLPFHPDGIEHVHFNRGEEGAETNAQWLAFIHVPTFDHVCSELTQREVNPAYTAAYGIS